MCRPLTRLPAVRRSRSSFIHPAGRIFHGNYKAAEDKIYNIVRAGDLMGKFMNSVTHQVDTDKLQRFLDLGARVLAQ
jgi:hypothetical protein